MAKKPEDVQDQAGDQGETTVVDMTRAGAAEEAAGMADVGRAACQDVWTSADKHVEATTGAGTPVS